MDKLKPCPFCGNKSAIIQPFMGYWCVTCSDCGGSVIGHYDSKEEAIEEWNRRAEPWREENNYTSVTKYKVVYGRGEEHGET